MVKIRSGRLMLWGSAVLIAGLLVWLMLPEPVAVDIAPVQRGALRVTIDDEGITRVRERYVVSAPVAGRLLRVALHAGDPVTAGRSTLATFLPAAPSLLDTRTRAEAEARAKAADAAREQARVSLQRAADARAYTNSELQRQRLLARMDAVTEERLAAAERLAQDTRTQAEAAALSVRVAEHEAEAARAALQVSTLAAGTSTAPLTLRSPVDGVVLRVHQESESLVPAGTPLIEIGDPRQLEIVVDLLSTDAVKVSPGLTVEFEGWGGEAPLCGRVRRVEPGGFTKISALGVEEQRVNVLIDLDGGKSAAHRIGDGYRVEASVILWEGDDVVKVPVSALFRAGDEWRVFAVRDGRARETSVRIGQRGATEAEVVSGLAEGDLVIVHPGDTIADGVAVVQRE